jgi:hypothetical protein
VARNASSIIDAAMSTSITASARSPRYANGPRLVASRCVQG